MYFVTSKRKGYALFSMTPSERAANDWQVHREWPIDEHSHTELMIRLGKVEEPATVEELVRLATGA